MNGAKIFLALIISFVCFIHTVKGQWLTGDSGITNKEKYIDFKANFYTSKGGDVTQNLLVKNGYLVSAGTTFGSDLLFNFHFGGNVNWTPSILSQVDLVPSEIRVIPKKANSVQVGFLPPSYTNLFALGNDFIFRSGFSLGNEFISLSIDAIGDFSFGNLNYLRPLNQINDVVNAANREIMFLQDSISNGGVFGGQEDELRRQINELLNIITGISSAQLSDINSLTTNLKHNQLFLGFSAGVFAREKKFSLGIDYTRLQGVVEHGEFTRINILTNINLDDVSEEVLKKVNDVLPILNENESSCVIYEQLPFHRFRFKLTYAKQENSPIEIFTTFDYSFSKIRVIDKCNNGNESFRVSRIPMLYFGFNVSPDGFLGLF